MAPPRPDVIYVDVDGTLLVKGKPNETLIAWLREKHAEGFELVLWSMAGRKHAEEAAETCGVASLFQAILSKPGWIVDDREWNWIRGAMVVKRLDQITGPSS